MLLGKRKNNQVLSYFEPLPKRLKCSVLEYLIKQKLKIINNSDNTNNSNKFINPYFLDIY